MTELQFWTDDVEEFLGNMTDNFRRDWGLDAETCPEDWRTMSEDSWRLAKHVDQITPLFIRYATTLADANRELVAVEIESLKGEEIVLTLPINPLFSLVDDDEDSGPYQWRSINGLDFLRQSIAIRLAEKEAGQIGPMVERVLELLRFVSPTRSELARGYLSCVGECYMRGMPTQGVAMCRSVLEAALAEHLDFSDLVATGYIRKGWSVGLADMLNYVRDVSDLPHEVWQAANEVRRAGNTALHSAPGIEDLGTVLKHLTVVLDALADEDGS